MTSSNLTSQRPHLQILSLCELGLQDVNVGGGAQTFTPNSFSEKEVFMRSLDAWVGFGQGYIEEQGESICEY